MLPSTVFQKDRTANWDFRRYSHSRPSPSSPKATKASASLSPSSSFRDSTSSQHDVTGQPSKDSGGTRLSRSLTIRNMTGSFKKSVEGATKTKDAPPKTKYIEHLLVATHSGEFAIADVFSYLQDRLNASTWTINLKSYTVIHLMIREGAPDVMLSFLSSKQKYQLLRPGHYDRIPAAQTQGVNIRNYSRYLVQYAKAFRDTNTDWVRAPSSRLEKSTVDKGLLRETECVQAQLNALIQCDVMNPENNMDRMSHRADVSEITIFVFRLLVLDLLSLFQVLNQGLINILGHFFEMSKPDAERALAIYTEFAKQTKNVQAYLQVAKENEHNTRVEVPHIRYAPTNLVEQLSNYLTDADFEINRRQYIAEQSAKKTTGFHSRAKSPRPNTNAAKTDTAFPEPASNNPFPRAGAASNAKTEPTKEATSGPAPDLIDFFDSIEQNQTTMDMQAQPQQQQQFQTQPQMQDPNAFAMQGNGMPGFQQQQQPAGGFLQTQPTGFMSNNAVPQQQQPQPTGNPFFQQQQQQQQPQQPQQTGNPFLQMQQQQPQQQVPQQTNPFGMQQQQAAPAPQPLQPNFTGAGFGGYTPQPSSFQPGALGSIPQESATGGFELNSGMLSPPVQQQMPFQQTGQQQTTNPFRASMMMTQQTGMPTSTMSSPTGGTQPLQRQSTNPFARSAQSASPFGGSAGAASPFATPAPMQAQATGTNPFARASTAPLEQRPQTAGAMVPQATGVNPFRQGAFVNHQTGMGWQHNQQPIGGGLDQLPTMPVFPRPATQTPWQQQ